ncbi:MULTISPECIES: glycoside hydrolase family 5 protein [Bacillaceae]|uniref:Glycoside hydrolase family 5 protein n=1 Tax=Evansella alkalicola TaxID=745819 RepID=A0ABS6JWJ6_9BACI|nr:MULTISPECIES: glycoside hydrolase family 5 protein [Bacillaceae]MBU9722964.1 glycoside hydrolase family 5 protein [Bacillus alkalicola]
MELLQVKGGKIINQSQQNIQLRGTGIGGWMNMEDFITGHCGSEHTLRELFNETLGKNKATFFFDRFLNHFFNEDDIIFIKNTGMNSIRIPLNYRHFENDENPYNYIEEGFQRLDTIINLCEKHGLYVILDMHAAQGFQNAHWHSDNDVNHSLFWDNADYQNRFIALWEEFARRYKGRGVIAGYNIMNEPCVNTPHGDLPHSFFQNYQPDWEKMNSVYRQTVEAIRKIDPDHIIFLEGDKYSVLFSGLEAPFAEDLVYSSHNYTAAGFGPGAYPGEITATKFNENTTSFWNKEKQTEVFTQHEGTVYTKQHQVPLWVGEFGSVYNGLASEVQDRLRAMDDQIAVFEEHGAHWSTWTYKDVGVMGLVTLDERSDYMQLIEGFIHKKQQLGTDDWMSWLPEPPIKKQLKEMSQLMANVIDDKEFHAGANLNCLSRATLTNYVAAVLQPQFVKLFKGMSEEKLDDVLQSFSLKHCKVNDGLAKIIEKHSN